ncbi:MAG: pilus assembly protein [Bdellovibrio sp.]
MQVFFFLFSFVIAWASPQKLEISLGEAHKITVRQSTSIWIQDRDILKAEVSGSTVFLRGQKEGRTSVKIGSSLYQVQVLHPEKISSFPELQKELNNWVGLKAHFSEGDLRIEGELYRLKDWERLAQFARRQGFSYQMTARFSALLQNEAQSLIKKLLSRAHLPPQTLIFQPGLELRVAASPSLLKCYRDLLTPYGIQIVKDDSSLSIAPTVKVEITVAEIKRDFSLKYGLRGPSSYSAKVLPSGEFEGEALPFNLTALEAQGQGRILASPNILCRSGQEAEFLAGGEFPIKIMNYKTQDVVWKRYGISLRVKPRADASGRISLTLETEVATIDDSKKVDDIPGLLTHRVSSHFDLTRPRTIALSGLLKSEDGKSSEGFPILSRLPILGALFSSKDFRQNRSELIIFVRPSIMKEDEGITSPRHLQNLGADL